MMLFEYIAISLRVTAREFLYSRFTESVSSRTITQCTKYLGRFTNLWGGSFGAKTSDCWFWVQMTAKKT